MEVIRPFGGGKTTLLKLAAGLLEPLLQGSVRLLNRAQKVAVVCLKPAVCLRIIL